MPFLIPAATHRTRWKPPVACAVTVAAVAAAAQQAGNTNLERVQVAGGRAEVSRGFSAESPPFVVYSGSDLDDVVLLLESLEELDHLLRISASRFALQRLGFAKVLHPSVALAVVDHDMGPQHQLPEFDAVPQPMRILSPEWVISG